MLDAVVGYFTASTGNKVDEMTVGDIAKAIRREPDTVEESLHRLYLAEPPYLKSDYASDDSTVPRPVNVTERGLRATGAWPMQS